LSRARYQEDGEAAIVLIERVYKSACLFISWDKTYASNNLAYYLNDATWKGRSIQPALRALLKITTRSDAVVPSLMTELMHLEATCRGSVSAGAPLMVTYAVYAWHVTDLVRKWGGRGKHLAHDIDSRGALRAFMPITMGGLGLTTPLLMAGSLGTDAIQESIGVMRMICIVVPRLNKQMEEYFNAALEPISEGNKVINPIQIRSQVDTLKSTRVARLVRRHLKKIVQNPVLAEMLDSAEEIGTNFLQEALRSGARLPVELIDSIRRSDLDFAVEQIANKFLLSGTAQAFIPRRALARVGFANIRDAALVTRHYFKRK
jgi:hypothetical protein